MVKLVDTGDLKSPGLYGLAGSSPARGTTLRIIMSIDVHSEIQETRDTHIELLAQLEVIEYILKKVDIIKDDIEDCLERISND